MGLEMAERQHKKHVQVFHIEAVPSENRGHVTIATQQQKNLYDKVLDYYRRNYADKGAQGVDDEDLEYNSEKLAEKQMSETIQFFQSQVKDLKDLEGIDAIVRVIFRSRFVDYILKYKKEEKYDSIRVYFEEKLARRGFVLETEPAIEKHYFYVKVFAPFHILAKDAQVMKISMQLIPEQEEDKDGDTFLSHIFNESVLRSIYQLIDILNPVLVIRPAASGQFRPEDLPKFKGGLDQKHPCNGNDSYDKVCLYFFPKSKRILFTHDLITRTMIYPDRLKEINNKHVSQSQTLSIASMIELGIYSKFYPTHDGSYKATDQEANLRVWLKNNWCYTFFIEQPLDQVREYFGEKLALYFAFIGYYTVWLWSSGLLGLAAFIYGLTNIQPSFFDGFNVNGSGELFDNVFTIPFSVLMCIWATIYLEYWKRRNAYLSWWWDVLDYERDERPRPEWYGTEVRTSPITGKEEYYYPNKYRISKMLVSCFCVGLGVLFVILSVTGSVVYSAWARNHFGTCSFTVEQQTACINLQPIAGVTCNDPCYSYNSSALCIQSNFTIEKVPYQLCDWVNGACVPNCPNYPNSASCVYHATLPENNSTSNGICQFVDKYEASTITGSIINLVSIVAMTSIFEYIAAFLNKWENHKTQTEFENSYIIKIFFFQFLNNYSLLFYIAYFKGTVARSIFGRQDLTDSCQYGTCFTDVMIQLVTVFLGKQIVNQFMEILLPYFMSLFRRKMEDQKKKEIEDQYKQNIESGGFKLTAANRKPPQWIKDDPLNAFDGMLFDEYNQMAIQFGFVTMFVPAFPLAPFLALINNIFEIRTDAYKFLTSFQRPPCHQAQDIGAWEDVLQAMSYISIITNAFLCAFTSAYVEKEIRKYVATEDAVVAGQLGVVLVFEHIVLFVKLVFAYLIPDIPGPVKTAIDRENYLARKALEGVVAYEDIKGEDSYDAIFASLSSNLKLKGDEVENAVEQFSDVINEGTSRMLS